MSRMKKSQGLISSSQDTGLTASLDDVGGFVRSLPFEVVLDLAYGAVDPESILSNAGVPAHIIPALMENPALEAMVEEERKRVIREGGMTVAKARVALDRVVVKLHQFAGAPGASLKDLLETASTLNTIIKDNGKKEPPTPASTVGSGVSFVINIPAGFDAQGNRTQTTIEGTSVRITDEETASAGS